MARTRDYRAEYAARVARGAVKRGRDYDAAARASTAARRAETAAAKAARAAEVAARKSARAAAKAAKAAAPAGRRAPRSKTAKTTRPVKLPGVEGVRSSSTAALVDELDKAIGAGQAVTITAWSRRFQKWVTISPRIAYGTLGPDLEGEGGGRRRGANTAHPPSVIRTGTGQWRGDALVAIRDLIDEEGGKVLDDLADAEGEGSP